MRIKLHNSFAKIDYKNKGSNRFLFDEKVITYFSNGYLLLKYRIDDRHYFLEFSPEKKELTERSGFGSNDKHTDPKWWRDYNWKWKYL